MAALERHCSVKRSNAAIERCAAAACGIGFLVDNNLRSSRSSHLGQQLPGQAALEFSIVLVGTRQARRFRMVRGYRDGRLSGVATPTALPRWTLAG